MKRSRKRKGRKKSGGKEEGKSGYWRGERKGRLRRGEKIKFYLLSICKKAIFLKHLPESLNSCQKNLRLLEVM